MNGHWICVGERDPVKPEEMCRRGWDWFAPAIAPPHPMHDPDLV
jgi:hypothetical protein